MNKIIDLNKTVYDLSQEDSDIIEIMKTVGFNDISSPGMLNTAGRFMTILKGAKIKKIDLEKIKQAFIENGYEII